MSAVKYTYTKWRRTLTHQESRALRHLTGRTTTQLQPDLNDYYHWRETESDRNYRQRQRQRRKAAT